MTKAEQLSWVRKEINGEMFSYGLITLDRGPLFIFYYHHSDGHPVLLVSSCKKRLLQVINRSLDESMKAAFNYLPIDT